MGDRTSTTFQFFGRLKQSAIPELINLLTDEGADDPLDIGACHEFCEVNWGQHDDLASFANENGLGYVHTWQAGMEYGSAIFIQQPDGSDLCSDTDSVGRPVIAMECIDRLGLKTLDALRNHLAQFRTPVPALEIIADE